MYNNILLYVFLVAFFMGKTSLDDEHTLELMYDNIPPRGVCVTISDGEGEKTFKFSMATFQRFMLKFEVFRVFLDIGQNE